MMQPRGRRPLQRVRSAPLDVDRILDAAQALLDRDGLAGLTMRRLGADLGVDPMAIYHHVPGKRELILRLVERTFRDFDPRPAVPAVGPAKADPAPREALRAWARAYRSVAIRHPALMLAVLGDERAVAIASQLVGGPLMAALDALALAPAAQEASVAALVDYVHGAVLPAAARAAGIDPAPELTVDAEAFRQAFEGGLDVVLSGIDAAARIDRTT